MMSRIPSYPTDDNDAAVFSSSSSPLSSENYHHDAQPIRLSSSSSSSSSSSNRRDSLPPTRMGQLKPDAAAVNPLRLVKAETNPLANQALETISALERQKHAQKEPKKSAIQSDSSDVDWEQNLSSWKDRRKSKSTYQPKALEIGEEQEEATTAAGKRSKTFKELMDEKEKRSNGLGLYTYESEDGSGPSRDTSSRDAAAVTSTSKASISSSPAVIAATEAVTSDAQPNVLDPTSDASSALSSVSRRREFYFTDSLVEGVSRDLKTSLPTSSGDLEAGTLLVQQRPQEISLEFRTPTEISAPETKVRIQKTSTAVESAGSADSGSDSERKPWRSTDRRTSALTSVGPPSTSSSSGVMLRDRPPGGRPQQPRPSSYAFTGYSDTRSAKTEALKPPMRPPSAAAAAQVSGSTTRRESAGGVVRPLPDRQVNPPPPGALTRDRRVKSNWELNFSQSFEKSDRQEFRPHPHLPPSQQQQKSAEASSSAKFKQALSLFQSKEAEAGRPVPPPKASLTTQRSSLGGPRTTSRLPADESSSLKPIRATAGGGGGGGVETKRPIANTTSVPYRPSAETRTNRQTDETRPREYWGSVHGGLDGKDHQLPDRRRSMFDRSSKNEDNDDWRKGDDKWEASYQRSFESEHSKRSSLVNPHSTDVSNAEDRSPSKDTDQTKITVTRVENGSSEVGVLKSRIEINRDAAAAAAADDEREKIGVGSTVSWTLKLGTDPSPGKAPVDVSYDQEGFPETTRRRTSGVQSGVVHEYSRAGIPETRPPRDGDEGRTRDGTHGSSVSVPDWRMDQRRDRAQQADSTEPKSLYAFKYQTTNIEESIVESRDKVPTKAADFKTASYVEKPPDATEGEATRSRDLSELKDLYKLEDNSFSDSNSNQWNKQQQQQQHQQQTSISDIFSRRSADAVRVRSEPDERRPFIAAPSPNTAPDEPKYRREVEPTRRDEESTKCDVEIRSDRELRTENDVTDTQRLVGDVTAGSHDDRASEKAGPEVRGLGRTYGIGDSSRRRSGLGRSDYAEEEDRAPPTESEERPRQALHEPREQETQHYNVRQESAFEVNFSSFGLEKKKSTGDGAETDGDRFGGKTDQPLQVEGGGLDGSLLSEPSEVKLERNEKTSREPSPGGAFRHPPEDHGVTSTGDGNRLESHRDDLILEASLNDVAADMKLVELDSLAPFQVGPDSDSINISRSSNGVLTFSFTEADFVVGGGGGGGLRRPETKSRRDVSEDFIRRDSPPPPNKPQNLSAASEARPRSLTEDESSPSAEALSSPHPPPLPLEKPPNFPVDSTHSPSFEFSFVLPPPSRRMPSPEPASSEPVSPKKMSPEQMSLEPVSPKQMSLEPVSSEPVRNTDSEKLIDFAAEDRIDLSEFSKRDSMSEKSLTKAEIVFDDDHYKIVSVDGNSNISFDRPPINPLPPANINILQQQSPTVYLSLGQTHDGSKAASLPSKEQQMAKAPHQSNNEDTTSASSGEVTSSVKISPNNPPPPKKKPPEVPKTKPKPKTAPKSGDDWGFLANAQLLDTSANRDKCRLAREGPMAVKRRPKSAFFPSLETSDLFDISNGVGHRETGPSAINGYREEEAIDGRDLDLSAGNSAEAVSLRPKAIGLKGATRPLSYMGELNSSLAKKFKGAAAGADNGRDGLYAGDQLKDSTGNDLASNEPISSRYGELEVVDSSEKVFIRPRGSVKMPGLMNELNLSLKKKFQDNSQDSSDRETQHSVLQREVTEEKTFRSAIDATANSLKSIVANDDDDDDDVERGTEVPPPPLPNAPPPLPNWNSFPGDSPAGPPLPPSGPPPALVDFGSSEEEEEDDDDSGEIQFRVDASSVRRQAPAPDQKWWQHEESEKTDEMDFSFA